jgi:cation diffusion facilitator family transporter
MSERGDEPQPPKEGGESTLTVLVALAANGGIAIAKGVAAVISGSAAMAAETAHSVVDTVNELLLLIALKRSERAPDRRRPFGYGPERFFWAFVAAVSIFVSGAVFAGLEGVRTLLSEEQESAGAVLSSIVLAISFVLEAISWVRAAQQVRAEARAHDQRLADFLRSTDDPTAKTVFYEDSAALVGLVLAFAGVWLHEVTGSSVYDGIASLLIALLLGAIAFLLARTNKNLLVGSQADPRLVRAIVSWLGSRPEVDAVVDLLTQRIGTDRVLVCARLDFDDSLSAQDLERAALAMDRALRAEFPDVVEVFLEPVPRHDEQLRAEVRSRYGERIAEVLDRAGSRRP